MIEKNWYYQKTENDCWLCTLLNVLKRKGKAVSPEEVAEILDKENLKVLCGRAFFTYLPVVLSDFGIRTHLYLASEHFFLSRISDNAGSISLTKLDNELNRTYRERDAMYFLLLSVKKILRDKNIELFLRKPEDLSALETASCMVVGINANDLYDDSCDEVLHTLLVRKESDGFEIVDPYERAYRVSAVPGWFDRLRYELIVL